MFKKEKKCKVKLREQPLVLFQPVVAAGRLVGSRP